MEGVGGLEANTRGTQPFRGMQMENCCKEQPEKEAFLNQLQKSLIPPGVWRPL